MTPTTFLTDKEVIELTNKRNRPAQRNALKSMGIEHRVRPDGTVAILREHIARELGAEDPRQTHRRSKSIVPDFDAIRPRAKQ